MGTAPESRLAADGTVGIEAATCRDPEAASRLEWLEANGLGGGASSTVSGMHTRRYHGLLVAATRPPAGRMVLLSRLDETLRIGNERIDLGCNRFPGTVHPRGFEHLAGFWQDFFPMFEFAAEGVVLHKTVAALDGENSTIITYEVVQAPGPFTLELRPFLAPRDFHALASANDSLRQEADFDAGVLRLRPYDGVPEVFLSVPGASYRAEPSWWYAFEYDEERRRGLDFREDLFTPGILSATLTRGDRLGILVSTADPAGRSAFALLDGEQRRREALLDRLQARDGFTRVLGLAADRFIVRRGSGLRTVIAGYPWFGDWGRDTMIALPGLCLATGRLEDARGVLRAFAGAVDLGMLPNRFPDDGEEPEYNTVDATLWFFVAIHEYLRASGDEETVRDHLLPVLRDIVEWHDRGTRFGIRVDEEGLLHAGEPGVQLTWMDARVDGREVTPRHGRPVEINALWCNALAILAGLETRLGDSGRGRTLEERAKAVQERFARAFWNGAAGCLYDVLGTDGPDPSIRPNQIIALALPFPVLPDDRARQVLDVVESRLLTPVGLRTLDPAHPDYRGRYEGGVADRDGAYHQGTAWPWLLGPFVTALCRYRGEAGRRQARDIVDGMLKHLGEAGLGTVSEVFDGDPPHRPGGAFAQAWSVAELLRAHLEAGEVRP